MRAFWFPFLSTIDPERCDSCGTCFTACNVKAIGLAKGHTFAPPKDRFAAGKEPFSMPIQGHPGTPFERVHPVRLHES